MIVPALVASGMNDRASVARIEPTGLLRLRCSANRQERNRQKSVPVPNRIAIRNSSTSDETSQPARIIQARSPRAMTTLTPIVTSGTSASQNDR